MLRIMCALASICLCAAQIIDIPETVDELDVTKYLGLWYQMYASPAVVATFEANGTCITATYGPLNETAITVYNHLRLFEPTGPVEDIEGVGLLTDTVGQLEVYLETAPIYGAPYWVIKLGPETFGEEGLYEYSVITDPGRITLFVLARDIATFEAEYEQEVLEFLENNGFDSPANNPVKTYHDETCLYPGDEFQF